MIKSFLNGVIGGFSRTLGRILFYIFIALIFYFIFGMKNVDAAELNVNAYTYSTMGNTFYQRMFTGYNYYNGSLSESNFSLGTTYSGRLKQIHFRVDRTFNYTNSYTLTLQANTSDFRNYLDSVFVDDTTNEVQCTTISSSFISKTKISVTFVCPYQVNSLTFHFYAKENNYLTGDTNFNIKNILLEEHTSGQNNDDIINNNNENTQDIINNNNSNTQDIIENNNQNTQELIDNQNELLGNCRKNLLNVNGDVTKVNATFSPNSNGGIYSATSNWGYIAFFMPVDIGQTYTFSYSQRPNSNFYARIDEYQNGVSVRTIVNDFTGTSRTFTITSGSQLRIAFFSSVVVSNVQINDLQVTNTSSPSYYIPYGKSVCSSKLDDLNSSITSQTPMDSSIFSDWFQNFGENYFSNPLGNLITLPINLVQKLINYSSSACQPVQLGSLLGTNLTLTCFTLGDIITNSVVLNVIDLIMSLSLIVFTLKKAYETVSNLLSLGGENEVKKHFKFPTPMEFIATLFGGGN